MSIMSDEPKGPKGGKWELTYWMYNISSYGVGASNMIDIDYTKTHSRHILSYKSLIIWSPRLYAIERIPKTLSLPIFLLMDHKYN